MSIRFCQELLYTTETQIFPQSSVQSSWAQFFYFKLVMPVIALWFYVWFFFFVRISFAAPTRALKLVNLWGLFCGLFWNGRNYESNSNSLSGYFSFPVLSLPNLYNSSTGLFRTCNLFHALVFLKYMVSIIRISYSFHILLYLLNFQLLPLFLDQNHCLSTC